MSKLKVHLLSLCLVTKVVSNKVKWVVKVVKKWNLTSPPMGTGEVKIPLPAENFLKYLRQNLVFFAPQNP